MFRQRLANPAILTLLGANNHDQVVAGRIIGVQEIGDEAHQAQATGKDHQLIIGTDFLE
jgi:hypothetical protein